MASIKNFLLTELISFAQFIRSRISTTAFVFGFTFSLIVFATVISINSPETSPFTIPRHSWFHLCFFSSTPNSSQFSILSLNSQRLVDPNPLNRTDMGRTGVFSYKPEKTDVVLLKNFTAHSKHSPDNGTFRDPGRCNIFDGSWILDETYPGYYSPGSCPYIDEAFNCSGNGRPDSGYQRLRWKPKDCQIPRFDGKEMLERLRGKRLVFVGDSLNRNMWESLVCMLRDSLVNKSMVFEILGKHEFRNEGFYAFKFSDYNCTVEYFRSPFLVQEWEMVDSSKHRKETLRLDMIHMSSSRYKRAHIIVFNTGHWWTHDKTSKGKDYYQEGEHVYSELNVEVAFRKALHTWAKWVDANIDPDRTRVFFRGYSASHFRGGQWNSGGNCDGETKPIINDTYLAAYPPKMNILESVIGEMKTPVYYLNITRMTDYRKDGHPSVYRRPYNDGSEKWPGHQDCSHWCLPGVPDAWNELLYAALLTPVNHIRQNRI